MGNKNTKTLLRWFMTAAVLALALVGCGGGGGGGVGTGGGGGGTGGGTGGGGGGPGGITGTPTMSFITVSPYLPASLSVGLTQQFTASATYINYTTGAYSTVDVTNTATWTSSNAAAASISATGLASGLTAGSTNITATLSGVTSYPATLDVIPAQLRSMTISPTSATIAAGQTNQFTVTGTYSDGSKQILNSAALWSSSDNAVANAYRSLAFGVAPNATPVTITASYSSFSATAALTVSNYSIGGTVVDLPVGSSVTIQNGTEVLTIPGNGTTPVPFIFPTGVPTGGTYNVTVTTQPSGTAHACTVVDGGGTITTNFISFVQVVCGPAVGTIAGGLTVKMNLSNNGTVILPNPNMSGGMPAGGFADGTGTAALFFGPAGAVYDNLGNLYIADGNNNRIRKMTPAGVVTTFAGNGNAGLINTSATVTALQAEFNWPQGIAIDGSNNVYVADTFNNVIRKITQAGVVTTVAGSGNVGSYNSTNPLLATFNFPHGVAVDKLNNVYVADTGNSLIRKIASTGPVTTFAGSLMSKYLTDGFGTAAMFNSPKGIIVDKAAGTTLYVADTNNNAIRGILISNAQVYTVAGASTFSGQVDGPTATARFSFPTNVAVDINNNIFVADNAALIRKIVGTYSASGYTGTVTTLAGFAGIDSFGDGPALGSALVPKGIAVDASGNVFTTDGYNLIRKYTP